MENSKSSTPLQMAVRHTLRNAAYTCCSQDQIPSWNFMPWSSSGRAVQLPSIRRPVGHLKHRPTRKIKLSKRDRSLMLAQNSTSSQLQAPSACQVALSPLSSASPLGSLSLPAPLWTS
ncbi:hypothetical protein NPIL_136771 [Nephila pilipes]|uniref:Uncharacterized protein n=1 Tax=Nephila pilipes TaxID=299642 RepID=A0A8X6TQQ1_NEPPI|nr:hypothetical protein NPIL_136771 [Nephila pilipes]